jgi:23S rRNA (cytidine2498-2'-O)-methyltransferase
MPGNAYIVFHPSSATDSSRLLRELAFNRLIFTRQWFGLLAELKNLPEMDRATPITTVITKRLSTLTDVWLEYPDTNTGKEMSGFCRKFERPLLDRLQEGGITLKSGGSLRLHLFFLNSRHVLVGISDPMNSARWPQGIPRLRMPGNAPSRSTFKLEEALLVFLDETERKTLLQAGMHAVDLGAAPGGWTWQLVRRGLQVTAIDNGPMAENVMQSGLIEHLRTDGFTYRPPKRVDWLVCDMVEQPTRIAALIADWFAQDRCRYAIFNLKLPMKKRYQITQECLAIIGKRLGRLGHIYQLSCKQLYHDRAEVTTFLARAS